MHAYLQFISSKFANFHLAEGLNIYKIMQFQTLLPRDINVFKNFHAGTAK